LFVLRPAGLKTPFVRLVPVQTPTVLCTMFIRFVVGLVTHKGAIVEVKVAGLKLFNWNVPELDVPQPFCEYM